MLDYSEYKDVISILENSNTDNTYSELMEKENKVLDTINSVVKEYKDRNIKDNEFISRSISMNITLFWNDMNLMMKELLNISDYKSIVKILTKGERIIYIGCMCIVLAIILFFVESSK